MQQTLDKYSGKEISAKQCTIVFGPRNNQPRIYSTISPIDAHLFGQGMADDNLGSKFGHALSFESAFVYAEKVIRQMMPGTTFTSQELFRDLSFRFDRRRLAHILNPLRKAGFIIAIGATKEGQERRNSGWATKWARTRGGY